MALRQHDLPFEIGQLAEAKSFEKGFRSAWFRSKIQSITRRQGHLMFGMEYYDYEDEAVQPIKVYQKPPKGTCSGKEVKSELMVRPRYPQLYHENNLSELETTSEAIVVFDGVWQVGDFVDWLADGCYWSARIIEILDGDDVKIAFPDPPKGEGKVYEAKCHDLRPSLDWSLEFGWSVPKLQESENSRSCARLIQPMRQAPLRKSVVDAAGDGSQNIRVTPRSSLEFNESNSSHTSASSLPVFDQSMLSNDALQQSDDNSKEDIQRRHRTNGDLDEGVSTIGKPSCSDSVSSTFVSDEDEQVYHGNWSSENRRDGKLSVNSAACDSLESTIMDIEELVNKVRWLRQILKSGNSVESPGQGWQFTEHPAVPTSR